jgi:hypothetical protein
MLYACLTVWGGMGRQPHTRPARAAIQGDKGVILGVTEVSCGDGLPRCARNDDRANASENALKIPFFFAFFHAGFAGLIIHARGAALGDV